jgi:type IV fimbrial biogenesis protein FimT
MPLARLLGAMLHLKSVRLLRPHQSGFTLVELMITVAIFGISAALAAPNLSLMYARHELYQTTTSLHNRLMLARSTAISRNTMITATPTNLPSGEGQVTFTAPLSMEPFPQNVRFVLPLPAQPLGFTSRGLSTSPLAVMTIQLQSVRDPNLIYTISLAPSGKVAWCAMQVTPCVQGQ